MHWENLRLPVSFKIMLDQHFLKMTEQLHFLSIDLNRCLFDIERLGHLMSGAHLSISSSVGYTIYSLMSQ